MTNDTRLAVYIYFDVFFCLAISQINVTPIQISLELFSPSLPHNPVISIQLSRQGTFKGLLKCVCCFCEVCLLGQALLILF